MNDSTQGMLTPELPNQLSQWPNSSPSQARSAVTSGISAPGKRLEDPIPDSLHGKSDTRCVNRKGHSSFLYERRSNVWSITHQPSTSEVFRILDLNPLGNRQYERFGPPREGFGNPALISHLQPAPFGSWISFIPSHLGYNRALDAAVDCTVCIFNALILQETMKQREARRKYIKALLILQNVLNGPDALSAETLCAMMVLSLYEVGDGYLWFLRSAGLVFSTDYRKEIMNEDGQNAWIKHAGGSSRLVSCRGPLRFNTEFECAMLHAQVPPLVSLCLDSAQIVLVQH
jgi:hypothetical protein